MNDKKFTLSKTLWVNGLVCVAALLTAEYIVLAIAAVNMMLRWFTDKPLILKAPRKERWVTITTFFVFLLLGTQVSAQSIVINVDGKAPGKYYIEVTINVDRSIAIKDIPVHTIVSGDTVAVPPPTVTSVVEKKTEAAVKNVLSHSGTIKTAKSLATVAQLIGAAGLGEDDSVNAYNRAIRAALAIQLDASKWLTYVVAMDQVITNERSRNRFTSATLTAIGKVTSSVARMKDPGTFDDVDVGPITRSTKTVVDSFRKKP